MVDVDTTITVSNSGESNDGYQYQFRGVSNFRLVTSQGIIPIDLVNTASSIIFKFSGQNKTIMFDFAVFDDGVDVSNGNPGGIVTIAQQIDFLNGNDKFWRPDFDGSFSISQSVFLSGGSQTGQIKDINVDQKGGQPTVVNGSCTFLIGTVSAV